MNETEEPFFHRDGRHLVPTVQARGPWKAGTLHGRVIVAVLAAEIERQHGDPAYLPARLTVDMHRAPGMVPLEVVTHVVRDGHRIRVIDAELISDGQSAGRATCQMLRRTENPPAGEAWRGATWSVPAPDALPVMGAAPENMNGLWDMRMIAGRIGEASQRRIWMREIRGLVGGEPLSPYMRVASGADYVSPLGNVGNAPGYAFINSDLTLYLHRLPVGEWIGYETISHDATDGIGLSHCNIYDLEGRIGWGSVCALVQARVTPTGIPK